MAAQRITARPLTVDEFEVLLRVRQGVRIADSDPLNVDALKAAASLFLDAAGRLLAQETDRA